MDLADEDGNTPLKLTPLGDHVEHFRKLPSHDVSVDLAAEG